MSVEKRWKEQRERERGREREGEREKCADHKSAAGREQSEELAVGAADKRTHPQRLIIIFTRIIIYKRKNK